jgi:hypothetical protein
MSKLLLINNFYILDISVDVTNLPLDLSSGKEKELIFRDGF